MKCFCKKCKNSEYYFDNWYSCKHRERGKCYKWVRDCKHYEVSFLKKLKIFLRGRWIKLR